MRLFNRSREHDPLRGFFLTRLQQLVALRATPSSEVQTILLVERAFVSTLVECIRLGATAMPSGCCVMRGAMRKPRPRAGLETAAESRRRDQDEQAPDEGARRT